MYTFSQIVAAHFEKKFETHTVKLGQDLTIRCVAIGDKGENDNILFLIEYGITVNAN